MENIWLGSARLLFGPVELNLLSPSEDNSDYHKELKKNDKIIHRRITSSQGRNHLKKALNFGYFTNSITESRTQQEKESDERQ